MTPVPAGQDAGHGPEAGQGAVPGTGAGAPTDDVDQVDLVDVPVDRPVLDAEVLHRGPLWDLHEQSVDLGEAGVHRRQILRHPGSVAVLALDDRDRVLMIRQYRHPVGMELWELPAGLLDVPGEHPLDAARRELAEETDVRADRWDVLADWFASAGGSDETVRLYLARGIHPVPAGELHERTAEELGMPTRWVPLEQARDAVLAGDVRSAESVVGILAACESRALGWSTLRPPDAPWPGPRAAGQART